MSAFDFSVFVICEVSQTIPQCFGAKKDPVQSLRLSLPHDDDDEGPCDLTDMPSSQPIDIPDAKKRIKKKKRCRATDSFSGRFEGKKLLYLSFWRRSDIIKQRMSHI